VKVVSITEIQKDAEQLVEHVRQAGEPVLVTRRAQPAAYLIGAAQYEAMRSELEQLKQQRFWAEVAEAQAEHRSGQSRSFQDADALITELGLETSPAAELDASDADQMHPHLGR
jgi:prevent-host-death family protein